jgi:transcriptional regulator with XRE-family HTH domain
MVARIRRRKYAVQMAKRTISLESLKYVGKRLLWLRETIGQNQADWARALRVPNQMLNKWEKGTRQPNLDRLVAICAATGCTMDYLFRGHLGQDMDPRLRDALAEAHGDELSLLFWPGPPAPAPDVPGSAGSPRPPGERKPAASKPRDGAARNPPTVRTPPSKGSRPRKH